MSYRPGSSEAQNSGSYPVLEISHKNKQNFYVCVWGGV